LNGSEKETYNLEREEKDGGGVGGWGGGMVFQPRIKRKRASSTRRGKSWGRKGENDLKMPCSLLNEDPGRDRLARGSGRRGIKREGGGLRRQKKMGCP